MEGIRGELLEFLQALLTGAICYSCYYCVRAFRRLIRHKKWVINLEDLCYWIWAGWFFFWRMFQVGEGAIRWYFFAGTAFGATVCAMSEKKMKKRNENY